MPVIDFDVNKKGAAKRNYDYPKLHLKGGERARILVIEKQPVFEYVHRLQAPKFINGEPVVTTGQDRKGRDYKTYDYDFLGNVICQGDIGIVEEAGLDPAHCAMCKAAENSGGEQVQAPKRRFAMHVVRYKTKTGGFKIVEPFSVEVLVWGFTDQVYGSIADAKEEWTDLTKHDLLLGPCENEGYQKFAINVGQEAAWQESDERKKIVLAAYKNQRVEDLTVAIGNHKEARFLAQDLATIREAWAKVGASGTSLTDDLDSLESDLSETEKPKRASDAAAEDTDDDDGLEGLLGGGEEPDDSEPDEITPDSGEDDDDSSDDELDNLLDGGGSDDEPEAAEPEEEPEPAPVKKAPAAKAAPKATPKASESDALDELDSLLG